MISAPETALLRGPSIYHDPLHADGYMRVLPELNATRDGHSIVGILSVMNEVEIPDLGLPGVAWRALGDLDDVARSARRLVSDPIRFVPGLAENMTRLGNIALEVDDGPDVPVGTIDSYISQLFPVDRQRTFTGSNEERFFQSELLRTSSEQDVVLEGFSSIDFDTASTEELMLHLLAAKSAATMMKESMANVKRKFRPHGNGYFADNIRPYFEPLLINGVEYDAPGAAQLPWLLIEHALRGIDSGGAVLKEFYKHNVPYLSKGRRELADKFISNNGKSFFGHIMAMPQGLDRHVLASLYISVFSEITNFGKIHNKAADVDFKHREPGAKGGATYTPATLLSLHEDRLNSMNQMARGCIELFHGPDDPQ